MFLVDDLLVGLPVAGMKFIFRQIRDMADRELNDPETIRAELIELHRAYEQGAIDEATYAVRERELMARWRVVKGRTGSRRR